MTRTHREALASLVNGIECGFGFQVLVAQPGMGKTTLLFDLLERFNSSRTAFLFQQQHDSREFLQSLLIELKSESEETSNAKLYGRLNRLLSESALSHERVIVVVDEAQNLDDPVLETLRQLSNFETARSKLLQIVLAGQPQLAKKLARPEQEQLRQRVSTIARLSPLSLDETRTYLNHRLSIAGYRGPGVFTTAAVQSVWSSAHGIPRNMNTLCFNAMLLAYAQGARRVDEQAVEEADQDLDLDYVLADVAGSYRPSVSNLEYRRPTSMTELDEPKPSHHPLGPVPRLSPTNGRHPSTFEPRPNLASVEIEDQDPPPPVPTNGHQPSTTKLAAPPPVPLLSPTNGHQPSTTELAPPLPVPLLSPTNGHQPSTTEPAPQLPIPLLSPTNGHQLSTTELAPSPAPVRVEDPGPNSRDSNSHDVKSVEKRAPEPEPVAVAVFPSQPPLPSMAGPGSRGSTGNKILLVSLVIAALGAGVLFGHGFGTRSQPQVEEHTESLAGTARIQDQPPVPQAPPPQPRNDKKSRFTADDGPEVIVRTFPRSTPDQPDGTAQLTVESIFFDAGSDVVSNRFDPALKRIAEILAASPQSTAIIEGHTDNSGEETYNLELSTRRAAAIKQVLEDEYNIPAARLSTVGAGSSAPRESNSTTSGRASNRRTEVRIMHPGA